MQNFCALPPGACHFRWRRPWVVSACSVPLQLVTCSGPCGPTVGGRRAAFLTPEVSNPSNPTRHLQRGLPVLRRSAHVLRRCNQTPYKLSAASALGWERRQSRSLSASNNSLSLPLPLPQNQCKFIRIGSSILSPNNMRNEPPNPSIEGTLSGLRPPSAPHVKR